MSEGVTEQVGVDSDRQLRELCSPSNDLSNAAVGHSAAGSQPESRKVRMGMSISSSEISVQTLGGLPPEGTTPASAPLADHHCHEELEVQVSQFQPCQLGSTHARIDKD